MNKIIKTYRHLYLLTMYAYDRAGQRVRMASGNRDVQYNYVRNNELILVRDVGERLEVR